MEPFGNLSQYGNGKRVLVSKRPLQTRHPPRPHVTVCPFACGFVPSGKRFSTTSIAPLACSLRSLASCARSLLFAKTYSFPRIRQVLGFPRRLRILEDFTQLGRLSKDFLNSLLISPGFHGFEFPRNPWDSLRFPRILWDS